MGKHQKTKALLSENDIRAQCASFLRGSKPETISIDMFKRFVEEDLLPGRKISDRSCRRYLNELGYSYKNIKKGVYVDGHERADVVEYRAEFLNKIFQYEKFMEYYSGDDMATVHEPELNGEKKHVLVVHDECIFYSNDGETSKWMHPKHPILRKKGKGNTILKNQTL